MINICQTSLLSGYDVGSSSSKEESSLIVIFSRLGCSAVQNSIKRKHCMLHSVYGEENNTTNRLATETGLKFDPYTLWFHCSLRGSYCRERCVEPGNAGIDLGAVADGRGAVDRQHRNLVPGAG